VGLPTHVENALASECLKPIGEPMSRIIRRPKPPRDELDPRGMGLPIEDNNTRVLLELFLDCSSSMEGDPIKRLNAALVELRDTLRRDLELCAKAMVCLITFGHDGVVVWRGNRPVRPGESPFVGASQFQPPTLQAGGVTPMVEAVELGFTILAEEKRRLREQHLSLYRPVLWCIGDGYPTDHTGHYSDEWRRLPPLIAAHEAKKRFAFFSLSVGDIGPQGDEVFNTLAPDSHVRLQDFDFATAIRLVSDSVEESAHNASVVEMKRKMMERAQRRVERV
jgi:uncharacterized protein YegL